jgi:hypothetical protein
MPRVVTRVHSTFYDMKRKVQFSPVLDQRTGCFVGVAQVSDEHAAEFAEHEHFEVVSDEDYLEMVTVPSAPEPTEPGTGDPLSDAAGKSVIGARKPPRVPKSK